MKKYLFIAISILVILFIFITLNLSNKNIGVLNIPTPKIEVTTEHAANTFLLSELDETSKVEINLWTFPVGDYVKLELVNSFVEEFNKLYPNITVNVTTLDYATGDALIEEAIEARQAPDIVMEGPERLLANWGARGLLIDIQDMWDNETRANIAAVSQRVVDACQAPDGAFYMYPMVMTTHVMAINYEMFEKAGALKYIDQENRSWTTTDFIAAMQTIRDSGLTQTPGVIYTGGQGGDQGTRALVSNLYSANFTNKDHTAYTIDSREGIQGLELLQKMVQNGSLSHNANIAASDELQMFAAQETAVTFAWNATNESYYASQVNFTPFAMNFPSDNGIAELQGGIWGFGIFNNGKMEKVLAAKKFIEFLVDNDEQRQKSIIATNFFPVNSAYGNVYVGTDIESKMAIYSAFSSNLGDYYQITTAWPQQRIEWYKMLQKVFSGTDAKIAAEHYVTTLNSLINP